MAGTAEFGYAHLFAVKLVLLDNGAFDRHAVVIPTRNIRGVITGHGFGFIDKVFQNLIHGRTHMDIAVGKRRSVMQDKAVVTLIFLQHFAVNIFFFPFFLGYRFTRRKIGAHGKLCFRQIKRFCIVFRHSKS